MRLGRFSHWVSPVIDELEQCVIGDKAIATQEEGGYAFYGCFMTLGETIFLLITRMALYVCPSCSINSRVLCFFFNELIFTLSVPDRPIINLSPTYLCKNIYVNFGNRLPIHRFKYPNSRLIDATCFSLEKNLFLS